MRFSSFSDEWTTTILKDSASFYKGTGISKEELSEEGHPCVLYGELYTTYKTEKIEDVKSKTSLPAEKLVKSKANDVIIPASGETPIDIATACCIMNDDILLGGDLNIIRIKNHNGVFLSCQLNGKRKLDIAKIAQGASIVHLHNDDLKKLKCYFPKTICEEEKIVAFLSKIDERIETQSKIIEKLQSQMLAIYHQVFSQLNSEVLPLVKLCSIQKGAQVNGIELLENGPYYFMNGGIVPSGFYNDWNTETNTISISEGGNSCGYVQYNKERFWSGGHCYTLQKLNKVSVRYLYHFLKSYEKDIMRLRIGTGLPNIQKKDLEQFLIKVPSLLEQERLVKLLDSFELKIGTEEKLFKKYKEQKKFLLSNMFI